MLFSFSSPRILLLLLVLRAKLWLMGVQGISLQNLHPPRTPTEFFHELAEEATRLGLDTWDIYGDLEDEAAQSSFLRKFEQEVAKDFGKEDAVFVMSGGMAQSIALLVHSADTSRGPQVLKRFACHHTSHLLLHEEEGYRHLLAMQPVVLSTLDEPNIDLETGFPSVPPLSFRKVKEGLKDNAVSTLMLELPHREIGGKATPWKDILDMKQYCDLNDIRFHCDGARIFEATTAYGMSIRDVASPFHSIYISFYKGLGGISGAMLIGTKDFCDEARTWLRRFGGNLYTVLPFALAGYIGYQNLWKLREGCDCTSFVEKKQKLVRVVKALSSNEKIQRIVTFDPPVPETPIVHGYLKYEASMIRDILSKQTGELTVLHRIRPVSEEHPSYAAGYRSYFEWSIGEGNFYVPDEKIETMWEEFANNCLCNT